MHFRTRYANCNDAEIKWEKYTNGRPCMLIIDAKTHEVICVASVNMPEVRLQAGEICIKDYSEGEGVLEALQSHGIVGPVLHYVSSGYVEIPIVRVLKP